MLPCNEHIEAIHSCLYPFANTENTGIIALLFGAFYEPIFWRGSGAQEQPRATAAQMLERRTAGAARAAASSSGSAMMQRRRKRAELPSAPEAIGTSDADDGTDDEEKEDGDEQDENEEDDAQRSRKRRKQAVGKNQRSVRPMPASQPQEMHQHGSSATVASTDAQDEESEMGIIEEIYCENFMCHRKMRVNLVRELGFMPPS